MTARMTSPIAMANRPNLDGLLMFAKAKALGLPPLLDAAEGAKAEPIAIPIQKSECGRYYLASDMIGDVESREVKYTQRRFPMQETVAFGRNSIKRIVTKSGPCKAFRHPLDVQHVSAGTWFCIGIATEIEALTKWITAVGKKRSVGYGSIAGWNISRCDDWPGFPVLKDGRPMRGLPLNASGMTSHTIKLGRLTPPYWLHDKEPLAFP